MGSEWRSSKIVVSAVAVFLLVTGEPAGADMSFFSTFGPGDSYDINVALPVGGWDGDYAGASQFSFAGPRYSLGRIELAAAWIDGDNELNVALMTDVGGKPGSALESFSFSDQMGSFGSDNPLLEGTSVLHPVLLPGTPYWLAVSAPSSARAVWNQASPLVSGLIGQKLGTPDWALFPAQDLGAFRLDGDPVLVPVPGAALLAVVGLGFAGWRLRRPVA